MRYFAEKRSFATKFRGFEEIFDFFVFMIVVIMTETTIFVNIFDFDYRKCGGEYRIRTYAPISQRQFSKLLQ
jgi:hypothetical protein